MDELTDVASYDHYLRVVEREGSPSGVPASRLLAQVARLIAYARINQQPEEDEYRT